MLSNRTRYYVCTLDDVPPSCAVWESLLHTVQVPFNPGTSKSMKVHKQQNFLFEPSQLLATVQKLQKESVRRKI